MMHQFVSASSGSLVGSSKKEVRDAPVNQAVLKAKKWSRRPGAMSIGDVRLGTHGGTHAQVAFFRRRH
jgi:hypothetical protein